MEFSRGAADQRSRKAVKHNLGCGVKKGLLEAEEHVQWLKDEAARRGITVIELQAELDAEEGKSSDDEGAVEET